MADDPVATAVAPALVSSATASPSPIQPVVAEAVTPAGAAVVPPPATPETPAPVVATPAPDAKPTEPAPASLLGDAKPGEVKPAEAKTADAPVTVEPPKQPAYEPFTLPEGVKLDADSMGKLTSLLGETELATKADHAAMQGLGQKLIDMYVAEVKRIADGQQEAWVRTRDEWRNRFVSDPDIGGARREATLRNCASMIEQFGGNAEQQVELRQAFGITGIGDHPAMIRFINNMAAVLSEGKPVPAMIPRSPVPASKSARRYSNTMNGAN